MLQAKGVKVVVADTGKAAIDLLQSEPDIDAVLMDVMMPEMDGHTAVKKIRQELKLTTLPIIMLTAKAMKGDREISISAGASDYMAKPIDGELLFNKLQTQLFRN